MVFDSPILKNLSPKNVPKITKFLTFLLKSTDKYCIVVVSSITFGTEPMNHNYCGITLSMHSTNEYLSFGPGSSITHLDCYSIIKRTKWIMCHWFCLYCCFACISYIFILHIGIKDSWKRRFLYNSIRPQTLWFQRSKSAKNL